VEVVVLKQLGTAEEQNIPVDLPLLQDPSQMPRPFLGLRDRACRRGTLKLALGRERQPGEGQHFIQVAPPFLKHLRLLHVPHGLHRPEDEAGNIIAAAVVLLASGECLEQAVPLRTGRERVRDSAVRE
jgi:hypothetical protein